MRVRKTRKRSGTEQFVDNTGKAMIALLLLIIVSCCVNQFIALKIHHSTIIKRTVRPRSTTCIFSTDNDKKENYDASYYKGLITDPVNSEISDAKDNLSPNIKFIGIMSVIIAGLFGAFIFSNLDTPPPPY